MRKQRKKARTNKQEMADFTIKVKSSKYKTPLVKLRSVAPVESNKANKRRLLKKN